MKKVLLLMAAVLTGSLLNAEAETKTETVDAPNLQKELTLDNVKGGTINFALVRDGKMLYASGYQGTAFEEITKAVTGSYECIVFQAVSLADKEDVDEEYKSCYMLSAIKPDGSTYGLWGSNPTYLNTQPNNGDCVFVLGLNNQYGQDQKYGAVWDIQPAEGGGYTIRSVANDAYLVSNGATEPDNAVAWHFYIVEQQTISKDIAIPAPDRTATDAKLFPNAEVTGDGFDAATNVIAGGNKAGWSWTDGIDLSQYRYIVITSAQNCQGGNNVQVSISDETQTISGDGYSGYDSGATGLWFDNWNNHFSKVIDLEALRVGTDFNIYSIRSLQFQANCDFYLGNVYATNHKPAVNGTWENDVDNFRFTGLTANQYGTVCLPYQAASAGVEIYAVAAAELPNSITLEKVDGLLEAGVPYIYRTVPNKSDNTGENLAIFYQAVDATVDAPAVQNGLVGVFEETTAPVGSFVIEDNLLAKNKEEKVVAANTAYFDLAAIEGISTSDVKLEVAEPTAISSAKAVSELLNGVIYNVNGQRQSKLTKGLNIVGGVKVYVK